MEKWLGCKNIEYISHGDWADPELGCEDGIASYQAVEDAVCTAMKEEGLDHNNNETFKKYVLEHQDFVESLIIDFDNE